MYFTYYEGFTWKIKRKQRPKIISTLWYLYDNKQKEEYYDKKS